MPASNKTSNTKKDAAETKPRLNGDLKTEMPLSEKDEVKKAEQNTSRQAKDLPKL